MPSDLHRTLFPVAFFLLAQNLCANPALLKPASIGRDSLAIRTERGVELTRQMETFDWTWKTPHATDFRLASIWKTEWIQPGGKTERRRQDGRWYLSVHHPLRSWIVPWLATQGEFFDERAPNTQKSVSPPLESLPQSWFFQASSPLPSVVSPTTTRIIRGGGGVQTRPWRQMEIAAGTGILEDRRFGHVTSGALWESAANLTDWNLSGYVQNLSLQAEGENPGSQRHRDLLARYEVQREFSQGTSNRAEVTASEIRRTYFLDQSSRLATRKEDQARLGDKLTYAIRRGMNFDLNGELLNSKTEIVQGARTSSLKETSAAFDMGLSHRIQRFSSTARLGMQAVTQTIDRDILQGRQTNLSLESGFQLSRRDSLFAGIEISKYQLDTRDPRNNDDRDELRFVFTTGAAGVLNPYMRWEMLARTTLDHLVYLFAERSANNRWTRLFLLSSKLRHYPAEKLQQTFAFEISANYQAFDYEFNPRQVRSTVFRKLQAGDSLEIILTRTLSATAYLVWQHEELGRLFWHEFQEQRSDKVTTVYSCLEFPWYLGHRTRIALGGLWNHRHGIRFAGNDLEKEEVFQDLQTYGPMWTFQRGFGTNFVIDAQGQVVRQLELEREDRWLVMGEIGVSIKW
jgi:hypothetical protein